MTLMLHEAATISTKILKEVEDVRRLSKWMDGWICVKTERKLCENVNIGGSDSTYGNKFYIEHVFFLRWHRPYFDATEPE